jgi:hypothetical protein
MRRPNVICEGRSESFRTFTAPALHSDPSASGSYSLLLTAAVLRGSPQDGHKSDGASIAPWRLTTASIRP